MAISRKSKASTDQSSFLSEEPLANRSVWPADDPDWIPAMVSWPSSFFAWLIAYAPNGWFGKTSPVSCLFEADGTLVPSLGRWQSSGIGSRTEFWTLSTCEWTGFGEPSHNDDGVSSLWEIVETGGLPQRFFLTRKACEGILRRAEKRGRLLPPALREALEAVARTQEEPKQIT